MKLLHKIIFWSHLLAGVVAGLVIFIMSFTGVILMYESQITEYIERDARRVIPSADGKRLSYDELIARVRDVNSAARPAAIIVTSDPTASVAVNLGRENTVFVNPYTGQLLGGHSATHDFMHTVVDWHRWLGTDGEGRATARAITGACNLAFFWLAVTGVYLWWPRSWQWRGLKMSLLFNARLRGKARDWNWHNVIGFWSSTVLVVLTLTAAVMSYPWANDLLYTMSGSEPPPRRTESPAGAAAPGSADARSTWRSARHHADGELRCFTVASASASARLGDDHAAPTTARRWTGHGFNPGTRCLSSFRALTTHAQSRHRRRGEMGTLCQQQHGAKIAHLGARASYRRSVWIYRPDRRRTRLSRRLFSRLDRLGHGLAPLSFLAPHTERIYC